MNACEFTPMEKSPSSPPAAKGVAKAEPEPWETLPYGQYVPDLLASYESVGGLNHSDSHNMPSKGAVGEICEALLQILFPGFHDADAMHHQSLVAVTSKRFSDVMLRLEDQVRKAVRIGDPKKPTGKTPPILRKFCRTLPGVRELIRTDIECAFGSAGRRSSFLFRLWKLWPSNGWLICFTRPGHH
jgi:hypothetical protein